MYAKNGRILAVSVARRVLVRCKRPANACYISRGLEVFPKYIFSRDYSQTSYLFKKSKDDDEILNPDEPDIQTLNADDMTLEEIEKLLDEEERKLEEEEKEKFVPNWKPGMRKRPLQMSYSLEEFEYELDPEKHGPRWTHLDKRCGALAIKVGMMPVFDDWGVRHPCTVLFLDKNIVLGHKTLERDGYIAVRVAASERKRKNVGKCVLGQYKNILQDDDTTDNNNQQQQPPPYLVREFRVTDPNLLIPINTQIHAMHFVPGQNVDVSGISKGKGFQGPMKRHGFAGMPASHGVSLSHRAHGSVGSCQDPGKVFKGKKMAGRMGGKRVTKQNLRIIKIDRGRNLLYVLGSVPGQNGNFVEIKDSVKKPLWNTEKVLNNVKRPPLPTYEYDISIDGCGESGYEVFMPLPELDPLIDNEGIAA